MSPDEIFPVSPRQPIRNSNPHAIKRQKTFFVFTGLGVSLLRFLSEMTASRNAVATNVQLRAGNLVNLASYFFELRIRGTTFPTYTVSYDMSSYDI